MLILYTFQVTNTKKIVTANVCVYIHYQFLNDGIIMTKYYMTRYWQINLRSKNSSNSYIHPLHDENFWFFLLYLLLNGLTANSSLCFLFKRDSFSWSSLVYLNFHWLMTLLFFSFRFFLVAVNSIFFF